MLHAYTPEQVAAFESNFERGDREECWLWTGKTGGKGEYGRFERQPAQRVAWELYTGLIFPEGLLACHHCDTPLCVNPLHVWPGTDAQNAYDRDRKGRNSFSSRTHCPKGHPYDDDNTRHRSDRNGRHCRVCEAEQVAAFRSRPDYAERRRAYDRRYEAKRRARA